MNLGAGLSIEEILCHFESKAPSPCISDVYVIDLAYMGHIFMEWAVTTALEFFIVVSDLALLVIYVLTNRGQVNML